MANLAKWIQRALEYHQAGELEAAEPLYLKVLAEQPRRSDALFLLGTLRLQRGNLDTAAALLSKAAKLAPDRPEIHNNLGNVRRAQGQLDEAVSCYNRAMRLAPDYPEAHNNLGTVLLDQGKPREAVASLKKAIALKPDYPQAHNNLGNALRESKEPGPALSHLRRAIELSPTYFEAHYNLGLAFHERGELGSAMASYSRAIDLNPDFAEGHNALGAVHKDSGNLHEAIPHFRRAIELKPGLIEANYNLGNALWEQGRDKAAIEDAIACFNRALDSDPEYLDARWNRAVALLLIGNLGQGWSDYEVRFRRGTPPPRPFDQPRWDGSPLEGRTILVHAEQGFGDTFHLVRLLPMVRKMGGRVVFECQQGLSHLLSRCPGADEIVERGAGQESDVQFDVHIPLLSLPGVLRITLDTVPADVPYISADPSLVDAWRSRLDYCRGNLKVGVVWAGNPAHTYDCDRSCPLEQLAPLSSIPGVTLFSVQKGPAAAEALEPPGGMRIVDLDSELRSFSDTAALMANLDLVISVDSAVVHLAGAMGRRVWVLLPLAPDWRWLLDREDSPWYPTMRLFRQPEYADWATVVRRVASELEQLASIRATPETVCTSAGQEPGGTQVSGGLDAEQGY